MKEDPTIGIPIQHHEGDAGFDLVTTETVTLEPGECRVVSTGLRLVIPRGIYGQIMPRSGMAKMGLTVDGGVIDSSYNGVVHAILVNRNHNRTLTIHRYDRVVQILFLPVINTPLKEITKMPQTTRSDQGFGSTGMYRVMSRKPMITNEEERTKTAGKAVYKLGSTLTEDQKQTIHQLMKAYEDVSAIEFEEIKNSKVRFTHKINTEDSLPIKSQPYRVPIQYREWMRKEITEMEQAGIIRKSKSPWASPVVIVPKKTGDPQNPFSPRLCVDF